MLEFILFLEIMSLPVACHIKYTQLLKFANLFGQCNELIVSNEQETKTFAFTNLFE